MARARGANALMAGAFESAYGTPPVSGFVLLPFSSSDLGEEQNLVASDLLGTGREPLAPSLDVVNDVGSLSVPVDLRNFGYWLKLFLGAPTSAGAVAATGSLKFTAQPANNKTVTINGIAFTFVTGSPTGNQVQIAGSLAATLTALATALNASSDAAVTPATYTATGTQLNVAFDTLGETGNAFTLAAQAGSNATPSGATLTGGANTHTFVSGAAALPSMSIEIGNPEVPNFGMNFGAMGNTMKIGLARSGLLTAQLGLIAQGEVAATVTAAGTPTELAVERFTQFSGQVTRNGVALGNVVSADWSYSNDLDPADVIRNDGRIDGADPGMVAASGQIVSRFADTVLLDEATAATPCELGFGWSINASKSLLVTNHAVYLPRAKRPITGPKGIQATFPYQAAKDATLNKTTTIVLTNDVASY